MGAWKRMRKAAKLAAKVRARRLLKGPRGPGWSSRYELIIAFLRAGNAGELPEVFEPGHYRIRGQRKNMDRFGEAHPVPAGVSVEEVERGGVKGERVVGGDGLRFVYLHGGGYCAGSPLAYRPITTALAERAQATVDAVDYRRAPEHPAPAALEDALAYWRGLLDEGLDPARAIFVGDSAGGGLCVATMAALRDEGLPTPAGAALISPWTRLDCVGWVDEPSDYLTTALCVVTGRTYAGALDVMDPRVSPAYGSLAGLPPLFVVVGGAETMRPDGERLVEEVRAAGGEARLHVEPGEAHIFPHFWRSNGRGSRALDEIVGFSRKIVG